MQVTVTREHIFKARERIKAAPGDPYGDYCPIAISVREAHPVGMLLGGSVTVSPQAVLFKPHLLARRQRLPLPPVARGFVTAFDHHHRVLPIAFNTDEPEG